MNYLESVFGLKGKVVVITGGTGVIGSEIAKAFNQAEANVILLGRNTEALNKIISELQNNQSTVLGFTCDVLNKVNLEETNNNVLKQFGRIDVLVNAAGGHVPGAVIGVGQSVFDMQIDDFNKVNELNLGGTVLPTLVFGKAMAAQNSGSVINISSMASQRAITRAFGYSTAKAAVEIFTKWMAMEMALKFSNQIRVNAIAPGFLISNQNRELLTNLDGSYTERGHRIIEMTPFKRFGKPEELSGVMLWLASNASSFVTGTVIPIDGGFSSFSGV
ncbi:MAG: short-chain dehydrogenase/reductase SDR [Ignavibacteria bacterium]|nr:MAG: short-chain dehydrogenase/reductase SDR [Ignavibacteria bacterium]KAF0160871.1 MAG: short-chain dehydrogenase/reductase SDR [Ignavibacteria bacterium]